MKHKYLNPIAEMAVDVLIDYLSTNQEENPFSDDPPNNWQIDLAKHISFELLKAANTPMSTKIELWRST